MVDSDMIDVYVQPGESHLVQEPALMRTLLGSCVGIAFWAPDAGVGALCHPMLPRYPHKKPLDPLDARRYVDYAIHDLAAVLDELRVPRHEIQVKLFGGADVLAVPRHGNKRPTVGKMNSDMALQVLEQEGFRIVASKLGGTSGINLQFNTETGEVWVRQLN